MNDNYTLHCSLFTVSLLYMYADAGIILGSIHSCLGAKKEIFVIAIVFLSLSWLDFPTHITMVQKIPFVEETIYKLIPHRSGNPLAFLNYKGVGRWIS